MFQNVLVVAPHPDDAELGCGGLIARLAEEGRRITILTMTDRDGNVPYVHGETLETESQQAARFLANGTRKSAHIKVIHCTFPIREFASVRQRILTTLQRLKADLLPDLVLGPARGDLHQDHEVTYAELQRAFRDCTRINYQILRSNYSFIPNIFVQLTSAQLARKIRSVRCYSTQSEKPYCSASVLRGQAAVWGAMAGCSYAEAFDICHFAL